MPDSVYTTPQSVTSRAKCPRRRAISPKPSPYSSPFQIIDLSNEPSDLKTKLLEAEAIIRDLREERDTMEKQMLAESGLNESIVVERSHRVSTQETRIFRRDVAVFEESLKEKQEQILTLQDKLALAENEIRNLKEMLNGLKAAKEDCEHSFESLRARYSNLEEQAIVKSNDISVLREELKYEKTLVNEARLKLEEARAEFEVKLASSKKRIEDELHVRTSLEEKLEMAEKKLREQEKNSDYLEKEVRKSIETEKEQKVLSEVRQLSTKLEYLTPIRKDSTKKKERQEYLQLSARVIEETMEDLKKKNARLEKELAKKKEIVKVTKEELDTLKDTMNAAMGDSEQASKYLQEENMKLTRQKADIRCDLLEARRKLEGFEQKRIELEQQRDEALEEVRRITEEKETINTELNSLRKLAAEREEQLDDLRARIAGLEVVKRDHEAVKNELSRTREQMNVMGKHLMMADQQSSHFKALKDTAEMSRRRAIEQCNEMVTKIRELEASLEGQRKIEQEADMLRAENHRQAAKIEFMKEEISEVHLDYRQELTRLAAETGGRGQVEQLQLAVSQKDSELRSARKTIEEVKADNRKVQQMLDEVRQQQQKIVEENVRLRKGMADALVKIEEYKRNWETVQERCDQLERERAEKETRMTKLEEELQEKAQQAAESEQVVSYLHSQINVKQSKQPRLGRRSTLLSTVSEMDTSVYVREAEEVRQLEEQRHELLRNLQDKRRILAENKSHSTTDTTTVISEVSSSVSATSQSASELSRPTQGTMRHDIPHKWKVFRHVSVLSVKCSLCFVGIPSLAKGKKCAHCDVHVHAACAPRVNNTCGMPLQCANYYRENHTTVSSTQVGEGRMNGWLRVYRDDMPGSTWIASWAMMDLTRIAFYTNDGSDLDKPFFAIDLNQEQWVLRTGQEMPIECDDSMRANNVLMIKMPRRCLYILAPSQPSARRWADCLQTAQRKRMMLDSKPASIAEYTCLLVLNAPNNLNIFKAHTIEDWILFATQTGLFFTSISQPRSPMRIAGPNSVSSLEIMAEINCIAMVVNSSGQPALVPLDSLTLAMQSTQPSIRPEILPEFGHVTTIRYHQHNGQRFLLIADETHLHIRKYNATRDVFSHFAKIDVPEPVTFIESAPNGIVFASDTFYYVSFELTKISARPLMPPRSADYPMSAHLISDSELLLAYQNYGVFVGLNGIQSRKETIEWQKMPMEFTYMAPYLYVIHDDSIEILEVAERTGDTSKTVLDEREVFECVNAHVIGRQYEGVLISVSSKDSTEVHRFSAAVKRNGMTKRRGTSPVNTRKRVKN